MSGPKSLPNHHAEEAEQTLPEIARRLFTQGLGSPLYELPSAQLKLCSLLLNGPRTMSQIGEELNISTSAVTQLADRLEKAELVERESDTRSGGDRRTRHLALTQHGLTLMRARQAWRIERVSAAFAHLSEQEQAQVTEALALLLRAARSIEESA